MHYPPGICGRMSCQVINAPSVVSAASMACSISICVVVVMSWVSSVGVGVVRRNGTVGAKACCGSESCPPGGRRDRRRPRGMHVGAAQDAAERVSRLVGTRIKTLEFAGPHLVRKLKL